MAGPIFSPPWGTTGEREAPDAGTQSLGYTCGALPLGITNEKLYRFEVELKSVLDAAATTNDSATTDNVLRAIRGLIAEAIPDAAATGGFKSAAQLRATLPHYPNVTTGGGKLTVTSPSDGTVRLAGGGSFVHRGVEAITTVETDFATDPTKTYHLRWRPDTGFSLFDLADVAYNATAAAETNAAFDTTMDDMLIARVVTSSSNVANVTELVNLDRHGFTASQEGTNPRNVGQNGAAFEFDFAWNWGRRPIVHDFTPTRIGNNGEARDKDRAIYRKGEYKGEVIGRPEVTRYGSSFIWMEDWSKLLTIAATAGA